MIKIWRNFCDDVKNSRYFDNAWRNRTYFDDDYQNNRNFGDDVKRKRYLDKDWRNSAYCDDNDQDIRYLQIEVSGCRITGSTGWRLLQVGCTAVDEGTVGIEGYLWGGCTGTPRFWKEFCPLVQLWLLSSSESETFKKHIISLLQRGEKEFDFEVQNFLTTMTSSASWSIKICTSKIHLFISAW